MNVVAKRKKQAFVKQESLKLPGGVLDCVQSDDHASYRRSRLTHPLPDVVRCYPYFCLGVQTIANPETNGREKTRIAASLRERAKWVKLGETTR